MFRASSIDEDVIQKLAAELTGALTDNGRRDLRVCRLVDLGAEVMEASTRLANATLTAALEEQAEQVAAAECCPACGGPLKEKPPQTKMLKTQAGGVGWRQTGSVGFSLVGPRLAPTRAAWRTRSLFKVW